MIGEKEKLCLPRVEIHGSSGVINVSDLFLNSSTVTFCLCFCLHFINFHSPAHFYNIDYNDWRCPVQLQKKKEESENIRDFFFSR